MHFEIALGTIILVAAAFAIIGMVIMVRQRRAASQPGYMPKISISLDPRRGQGCMVETMQTIAGGERMVTFVRLKVEVDGCAIEAAAYVTAICSLSTKRRLIDTLMLAWSWHGVKSICLQPGVPRYIDLAVAAEGSSRLEMQPLEPFQAAGMFDMPARYAFRVVVGYAHASESVVVVVDWTGDIHGMTAFLASDNPTMLSKTDVELIGNL